MKNQNYTLQELVGDSSFIRWTTGRADTKEVEKWNRWIQDSEGNRKLGIQAQKVITGISFKTPSSQYEDVDWEVVKHHIQNRQKRDRLHTVPHGTRDSFTVFFKVAAIILLVAISGGIALYMQESPETETAQSVPVYAVSTDFSEKKTISLSDGSEIILASGSVLSYKENWLHQPTQRVTLRKGEAFFSIQPDKNGNPAIPRFEVETVDGTTAVMGTKFTVSTYGTGTQVVLEEGEVRVTVSAGDEDQLLTTVLAPGEMATWRKHQSGIEMREVNPRVYTSWISNQLFFDDTPLLNLVHRIERTYGVDVKIMDAELLEMKLSGAVDFHSLEALIYAVSDVLNISITQIDDKVIIKKTST